MRKRGLWENEAPASQIERAGGGNSLPKVIRAALLPDGREASKNVGGPRRSCPWKSLVYGLQLLRHGRGHPDTEPCWNLRTLVDQGGRQAEESGDRGSPS